MDITYDLLLQLIPALADAPSWMLVAIAAGLPALACFAFMGVGPVVYVYAERKISGFMQDRLGPMRVGPYGLLQTIADTVKLVFKEAIYPSGVDKKLFVLAPCLLLAGAFLSFVVVPFGSRLVVADLNVGILFVFAIASLGTYGVVLGIQQQVHISGRDALHRADDQLRDQHGSGGHGTAPGLRDLAYQ